MVKSYSPDGTNVHHIHRKPKNGCHGNVPYNLEIGNVFIRSLDLENPPLASNSVLLAITQPKL